MNLVFDGSNLTKREKDILISGFGMGLILGALFAVLL